MCFPWFLGFLGGVRTAGVGARDSRMRDLKRTPGGAIASIADRNCHCHSYSFAAMPATVDEGKVGGGYYYAHTARGDDNVAAPTHTPLTEEQQSAINQYYSNGTDGQSVWNTGLETYAAFLNK